MVKDKTQEEKIEKTEAKEVISYYEAVGRRKVSSARVRLYVVNDGPVTLHGIAMEKGGMVVNGRSIENYFPGEVFRPILKKRGFMKRDPRAKQRRKAGFAGKARARRNSPKR
jgi:ribosomal protein S9